MATLTGDQKTRMRHIMQSEWTTEVDFTKTVINAVFQAIEDEYERNTLASSKGFKMEASGVIDTASSPKVFTNAEKKIIGRAYLGVKFNMEVS